MVLGLHGARYALLQDQTEILQVLSAAGFTLRINAMATAV